MPTECDNVSGMQATIGPFVLAVLVGASTRAQDDATYRKIRTEAFEHGTVMANLAWLCDRIGPRLTGTPECERASQWTRERFEALGLRATLEPWEVGRRWTRVAASARIVAPIERRITVAAGGWTPSTDGALRAEVVDLTVAAGSAGDDDGSSRIAGRIVLTGLIPWHQRGVGKDPFRAAAARLVDSRKPHALLDMTSLNWGPPYSLGTVPSAFTTSEDFRLLQRLCASGDRVEVELEVANEVSEQPVTAHNTVAELPGTDLAEQIVIAGAHLDSWDLASGTTDNGVGSMVVLEAARILTRIGARPRRTIRFVLFTGEEQGLVGSRHYVERHADEMGRHVAGLVMDIGTGSLRGLTLHGQTQVFELVERWFEPVRDLGFHDVSYRSQGGTDHLSFQAVGVPAFAFVQDPVEYDRTHHSQSDTWDKASEPDLQQAACVMATGLWAIANHDGEIPRFDPGKPTDREHRGR
jgi:hypothetical protein